jgi:hypothetical protein
VFPGAFTDRLLGGYFRASFSSDFRLFRPEAGPDGLGLVSFPGDGESKRKFRNTEFSSLPKVEEIFGFALTEKAKEALKSGMFTLGFEVRLDGNCEGEDMAMRLFGVRNVWDVRMKRFPDGLYQFSLVIRREEKEIVEARTFELEENSKFVLIVENRIVSIYTETYEEMLVVQLDKKEAEFVDDEGIFVAGPDTEMEIFPAYSVAVTELRHAAVFKPQWLPTGYVLSERFPIYKPELIQSDTIPFHRLGFSL